ncbi:hypothetical protein H072_2116 [Dactylellina haptotyla CBS 200.50]|uniref:F-box domain-containing protein n=1 Tax=Dactylellina haptotyla (strain CBS 200.50) TaxID=1284197 RepID=S8ALP8_DACHA|nr:hypothetical protein H072_2116 [Dactylellina haptotyla CBS 200.50]
MMTDCPGSAEVPPACQCVQLCTCEQEKRRPRFLNLAKRSFTNISNIRLRSPKSPREQMQCGPMTPPDDAQPFTPIASANRSPDLSPTAKMESPILVSPVPQTPIARKPVPMLVPTIVVPQTKPFAFLDTPEQTPTRTVRRDLSPSRNIETFGLPASKPIQKRSFSLVPENTPRSPIVFRTRGQSMDHSNHPIFIPKRKPVPIRIENASNPRSSNDGLEETIEQTIAWLEQEQYEEERERDRRLAPSPVSPLSEKADEVTGSSDYTPLPLHHERVLPAISGFPSFSSGSTLSSSPSLTSNSTSTSVESRSKTPPLVVPSTPSHAPRITRKPIGSPSVSIPRKAIPKQQKPPLNIQSLPNEVILKILSHLPSLDSVMAVRLLSPRFNDLVSANTMPLIYAVNPSAYTLIQILFPGDDNFESFRSAYNSCLGVIDGLISRIRRRCPGLLRREMLDPLNRDEIHSMRMALWNIWCFSLVFSGGYTNSEECIEEHRVWLSRFGRKELFAMIEMCGLICVLLRPLLEIAYSVELTDKFRRDVYFDDQPLDIKERYELIENLLAFLRTVGLDHVYELSSIFGSSESAASPRITRNIACDYIIENLLIETWERELGKEYSNFMIKPMKELHLELEREARKIDFDGKKAREGRGWGPTILGNDEEELVPE